MTFAGSPSDSANGTRRRECEAELPPRAAPAPRSAPGASVWVLLRRTQSRTADSPLAPLPASHPGADRDEGEGLAQLSTPHTRLSPYELPLGPLGRLAHPAFVNRDLERIFTFRQTKLAELLAPSESS